MNINSNRIYIDSTDHLTIGLLDHLGCWKSWQVSSSTRPSEVLHQALFELITKFDLNLNEVDFVFSAGPGSYTGMRLGEGLAKILEWDKKRVYTIFQFDIFRLAGTKKGFWFTPAFKDEVFVYTWDVEKEFEKKSLIPISKFNLADLLRENGQGFARGNFKNDLFDGLKVTDESLKEKLPFAIEASVRNNIRKDSYYFRPLEDEFK